MPLKLEEFYKDINLQEGFFYEELVKDVAYQLEKQMADRQENYGYSQIDRQKSPLAVLAEEIADSEELKAHENLSEYNNRHRSNHAHKLKQRLVKIKEYLATRKEDPVRAIIEE